MEAAYRKWLSEIIELGKIIINFLLFFEANASYHFTLYFDERRASLNFLKIFKNLKNFNYYAYLFYSLILSLTHPPLSPNLSFLFLASLLPM